MPPQVLDVTVKSVSNPEIYALSVIIAALPVLVKFTYAVELVYTTWFPNESVLTDGLSTGKYDW